MYTIGHSPQIFVNKKRLIIGPFSLPSLIFFGGIVWPLVNGQGEFIWKCDAYSWNGRPGADCSKQNKDIGVPTNLDSNLEFLNLSRNTLTHLTDKSFERYPNLILLDISKCGGGKKMIDPGAFLPLQKLLYLNMSLTCFPPSNEMINYAFPKSVKEFSYSSCDTTFNINLTTMESLEVYISTDGGIAKNFPIFSKTSPRIRYVDLRSNPLDEVRPIEIAPYCHLEEFLLESRQTLNFKTLMHPQNYCKCMKVKKWLDYAKVKYGKMNCVEPDPEDMPTDCNYNEIDPESIQARKQCLEIKLESPASLAAGSRKWLFIIIFIILAILALILVSIIFLIKKIKTKSKGTAGSEEPDHEHGPVEEEESEHNENAEEESGG